MKLRNSRGSALVALLIVAAIIALIAAFLLPGHIGFRGSDFPEASDPVRQAEEAVKQINEHQESYSEIYDDLGGEE